MKTPAPPSRSLTRLRDLTPARVGLGRAGASLPTEALLEFTLDHARARDAVHAAFDVAGIIAGLADLGLAAFEVSQPRRATGRIICGVPILDGRSIRPRSNLLASHDGGRAGLRS